MMKSALFSVCVFALCSYCLATDAPTKKTETAKSNDKTLGATATTKTQNKRSPTHFGLGLGLEAKSALEYADLGGAIQGASLSPDFKTAGLTSYASSLGSSGYLGNNIGLNGASLEGFSGQGGLKYGGSSSWSAGDLGAFRSGGLTAATSMGGSEIAYAAAPAASYHQQLSYQHIPVKTITKTVPRPYTVEVAKPYPVEVKVAVPVDRPYTVEVPKPYTVSHEKPYPVNVPVPHPYPVVKEIPVPVNVHVDRPYPVHVDKPYPVYVEKKIPYPVEKHMPYPVKVPVDRPYPVHVPLEKIVPYPVEKTIPYPVKVNVDRPYPVQVIKNIPYPVEKSIPYPVEKHVPYPVNMPYKVAVPMPYPVKTAQPLIRYEIPAKPIIQQEIIQDDCLPEYQHGNSGF